MVNKKLILKLSRFFSFYSPIRYGISRKKPVSITTTASFCKLLLRTMLPAEAVCKPMTFVVTERGFKKRRKRLLRGFFWSPKNAIIFRNNRVRGNIKTKLIELSIALFCLNKATLKSYCAVQNTACQFLTLLFSKYYYIRASFIGMLL